MNRPKISYEDSSNKLFTKQISINSNGERIVTITQEVNSESVVLPFYLEYFIEDDLNFKLVSTAYYAKR